MHTTAENFETNSLASFDPHGIGNSSMWQSERWNRCLTKISVRKGFFATLQLAFQLVLRRSRYDVVYTAGIREAQMYGLLCAIFGTGGKPHVATEILLDEARPASLAWRIKRRLRRFALRNVTTIIVFSSAERKLYSQELNLPLERIRFIPFHTNILEPKFTPPGIYGFAAGRSLRDYETLFAAVDNIGFPFVVVASRSSIGQLRKPGNVELHCDVPRACYLELLEGARFVVVPLKADYRSAGQVVVLEAASLGKPVVASDVIGVRDYITHMENGVLVEPGNPQALRTAIQTLLDHDDLCKTLAADAMRRVNKEHTFDVYVDHCLQVMAEAANRNHHQPAINAGR